MSVATKPLLARNSLGCVVGVRGQPQGVTSSSDHSKGQFHGVLILNRAGRERLPVGDREVSLDYA